MKVTAINTRPLRIPYKKPFYWARGKIEAAEVILVEVQTDAGVTGYGESMSSACAGAVQAFLQEAGRFCLGQSPFAVNAMMGRAYQHLFAARGTCSAPHFGALVLAGLDMALWDAAGKAAGCAVHELLGGAMRERIQYFGFPQGETAEGLAKGARDWAESGSEVIYIKIGRGEALDLAIAEQVRVAIGNRRLRLDANEAWDLLTAQRMIRKLAAFEIEFIEQPTPNRNLAALAQVKAAGPVAIAADQSVFTPEDVYAVCRAQAADLIVLGLHETGGIGRFCQASAVAAAAGLNICLHGVYESGVTTCASNQVGAAIGNLDDGNQYMNHFLEYDLIVAPDLALRQGQLPVLSGPGLGFELNWDAINQAEEDYRTFLRLSADGQSDLRI